MPPLPQPFFDVTKKLEQAVATCMKHGDRLHHEPCLSFRALRVRTG